MRYRILIAGFDGIMEDGYDTIKEVLDRLHYSVGWESKAKMHQSIKKWARIARPGSIFRTRSAAIVCSGVQRWARPEDECPECLHQGMEYQEFEGDESGDITQIVTCPNCQHQWQDCFTLTHTAELEKPLCRKKKPRNGPTSRSRNSSKH